MRLSLGVLGIVLLMPARSTARDPDLDIRFNRDIRPILIDRCFACHGPDIKKAGLDFQNPALATKALKSGVTAVVPGSSAQSEMIRRVMTSDEDNRMPPKGKGTRLAPEQIATLKRWIDGGAKWEEHWSYIKPVRPPLPSVKNIAWVRNEIDQLVLGRLEKDGLAPSPVADRATLIRRVSLDLTGLPPSLEEVDAFCNDRSRDAYEKVVDRLLASKHYGERQAHPWLDQARYADTNGYEKDDRRTMWPYRDWVINAFNRDMPFDQFTIEQIAGDLLPHASPQQQIATGFHRNTMVNTEGGIDDEEFRVAAVVDRVNTTMAVWMGTTMGCAQCHNHKFDPFTQAEYYQLFAFFNNTADKGGTNEPILLLPTAGERARQSQLRAASAVRAAGLVGLRPLPAASTLAVAQVKMAELQKQMHAIQPATTQVMKELPQPRATHVMVRGNHKTPGAKVSPGVPQKWYPLQPTNGEPVNRLALARWLVSSDNPLVARVTMNRIWARYFGRGLVETSEDFGARGDGPSNPKLLDWLATEFVRQEWSQKAMHRLIVTSATYRQSSGVTPALSERDPYNRLLARGPRFRMDAEMVRDNALAIGGILSRKVGGPSLFPYQPEGVWNNPYSGDRWVTSPGGDQYRRGLYTFWRRTAPYATFMAFDAPSREVCTERRPCSNTPLQALAVLNDKAFVEPAAGLARRMLAGVPHGIKERAIYGFRLCVAREPSPNELDVLVGLYQDSLEKYQRDAAAAKELAAVGSPAAGARHSPAELAAWIVIANVMLNLDETVTKG